MKKLFIISAVLLLTTLLLLGIYNFAFKKNQPDINTEKDAQQVEKKFDQSDIVFEKIYAVSDQGVIGATYDKKTGSLLYYSAQDGTTWSSDRSGQNKKQISKVKVPGLKNAEWAPDKSKVLTIVSSQGKDNFYVYDVLAQKATALKSGLDAAAWDNMSSKIFYKYYNQADKSRSLNIANPDGSDWKKIADINSRDLSIAQIPLTSLISFWNAPAATEESLLQTVGITSSEVKTVFKGKYGADYLWAPNGSLALVSLLNEAGKITLGTVNLKGEYLDLNVPTFVSKCVWSSDNKTVYYALAGAIPENSVVPDDYESEKFNTKDTFWKLNLETGKKERIVEPEEIKNNFDASQMFLSPAEDELFFVNRIDKKLYKIEL